MANLRPEQIYPSDLTDTEWGLIEPLIPVLTGKGRGRGRPRTLDLRQVLNALLYIDRTGCQWEYLPRDFPNHNSVRYYYDLWREDGTWARINRALQREVRQEDGLEGDAAMGGGPRVRTTRSLSYRARGLLT